MSDLSRLQNEIIKLKESVKKELSRKFTDRLILGELVKKFWTFGRKPLEIIKLRENQRTYGPIILKPFDGLKVSEFAYKVLGGKPPTDTKDYLRIPDRITRIHKHIAADVVPQIDFYSWNVAETSPSGNRHTPSGHPAFESHVTNLGYLDFGQLQSDTTLSATKCLTFKVKRQPLYKQGIQNMRIWKSSDAGLGPYGTDFSLNMQTSNAWVQNKVLTSGLTTFIPTSLPVTQNVFRNDDEDHMDSGLDNQIVAPDKDKHTSEFIYLSLNLNGGYPNGKYGFGGTGSCKVRCTYDFFLGGYGD